MSGAVADAVFFAPHADDVALSCGGTVARLAASGASVAVVTVFGGEPPPAMPLTPYAQWNLRGWRMPDVTTALAARRREDAAAIATLGATLHTLPFVDGAFRGDRYASWDALRARPHPDDAALPERIADAVTALGVIGPGTPITGPLAIGRHVDHQLVFAAMGLLAARGHAVRGYEDFPYAAQGDEWSARITALGLTDADAEIVDIGPWLEAKTRAIARYASQLPLLFPDAPMPHAVHAYAVHIAAPTGLAERFWRLAPGGDDAD